VISGGTQFLPRVWSTSTECSVDSGHVALSTGAAADGDYADQLKLSLHKCAHGEGLIQAGPDQPAHELRMTAVPPLQEPARLRPEDPPHTGYARLFEVFDDTPAEERTWAIQLQLGAGDVVYTYSSARMLFHAVRRGDWDSDRRGYGEFTIPMTRVTPAA
jgi:hypothetical protein